MLSSGIVLSWLTYLYPVSAHLSAAHGWPLFYPVLVAVSLVRLVMMLLTIAHAMRLTTATAAETKWIGHT